MEGAPETVWERLLKLRLDRGLVDHRPDLSNSLAAKLIEDILGEDDLFAVHRQAEEETLRPAVESKPARDVGRFADQKFDVELKIRNLLEIALQHRAVSGEAERPAVVARVVGDKLMQIRPILPVQAGDVAPVEVGEGLHWCTLARKLTHSAGMKPMIELFEVRPDHLRGDLGSAVQRLLREAFRDDGPNEGDYYRKVGPPGVTIVLHDGPQVFGHLGLYTREVAIGNEALEIGMLGGVVVAPERRRRGYSRLLVRHAHEHLKERRIPFSILFAYEPRIYEGSGYKLMQNSTHFIEADGTPRTLVYRGGMYAELSQRRRPNQLLDLRGPTV